MEEQLVPAGNALRPRSLVYVVAGFGALVVLLASDAHFALTVPLSLLCVSVCGFGALDFWGCFDDAPDGALATLTLSALQPRLLEAGATALLWVLVLRLAVAGTLPHQMLVAPLAVTLSSGALLLAVARLALPWARLREHPGFWLVLLGLLLYVPLAGCYSLLDPWETHYGEVTREMLARDDWLSFWWAQEGWFWSKPALDFWLQGLFFSLLSVNFRPDQMLAGAAHGRLPQPEWAARMPSVLLSLLAVYALYRFVASAAGKRAGLLAGLVLLCAPYWSLLGHQSMTDMPYVAPLTIALSCFGLALLTDPNVRVTSIELSAFGRKLRLSGFHLLFAAVLLSVLPQLAYLATRNLTLQLAAPPYGFRWHLDEFFSGSGLGNCGLPGNEPCRRGQPGNELFQPLVGASLFGAALGYLLFLNRAERRKKRLLYIAAWYFTALSALAKGAPGLVLPLAIALLVLVARRDFQELVRSEPSSLALTFAAVCLPWYVQAYMRHGEGFTDRLLFHDMYKRAFVHVHDTNAGTDVSLRYYIWQLGYGLFPWTGVAFCGVGALLERGGSKDGKARDLGIVGACWLTLTFALFTLSLTKFHHYALPCAPPLSIAAGLLLDRALGAQNFPRGARLVVYLSAFAAAALLLLLGGLRLGQAPLAGGALLLAGLLLAAVTAWRVAPAEEAEPDSALAVLGISAALVTLLVARDLSTSLPGDVPGSARLLHLITYNYKRTWPGSLDFDGALWAFGVASALTTLLLVVPRARRHAVLLSAAIGAWFCAFTLWIYLPALAPHFGQRELFLAYYAARRGPEEPVVAYQMNWKGENFYTGNHIPAFVSTGAKFEKWLKLRRRAGTKVLYFVVEHGRLGTLKSELGTGFRTTAVTDRRLNDKFGLVRAELVEVPKGESDDGTK